MSNIFDALQRAETESSGREGSALVTELLESAELKIRGASLKVEPFSSEEISDARRGVPQWHNNRADPHTCELVGSQSC